MRIVEDMLAYDGELRPIRPSEFHDWIDGKWVLNPAKQTAAFDKAKAAASASIDQFHADTVQKLVGNPTQVEKDTWALKLETANAIAASDKPSAAGAAFLQAAGLSESAAQAAWAAAVLKKSAGYAAVVGLAERLRDEAKTAVKAASTITDVQAALDAQRAAADAAVARMIG